MPEARGISSIEADKKDSPTTQSNWILIGKIAAVIFAIACGLISAYAFLQFSFLAPGVITYLLTGVLFAGTVGANIKMCIDAVPSVLIDIFGKKKFLQGITETNDGAPLSTKKKLLMGVGFILALSAGIPVGAMAYSGFFAVLSTLTFLSGLSVVFPPLAVFVGITAFVVLAALTLKSIAELIKTENLFQNYKKAFFDFFNITNKELLNNKNKSKPRIIAERVLTVVLGAVVLPLSFFGLFMGMKACSQGLYALMIKVPTIASTIAAVASDIIALGLAFVAQIPFVFRTTLLTVGNIFTSSTLEAANDKTFYSDKISIFKSSGMLVLRAINAIGYGMLSMVGARGAPTSMALACAGGFTNAITSSADDPPATTKTNVDSDRAITTFLHNHQKALQTNIDYPQNSSLRVEDEKPNTESQRRFFAV